MQAQQATVQELAVQEHDLPGGASVSAIKEANSFAQGFLQACVHRGMTGQQICKAASVASELDPVIAADLEPLTKRALVEEVVPWLAKMTGKAAPALRSAVPVGQKLLSGPGEAAGAGLAKQLAIRTVGGALTGMAADPLLPDETQGHGALYGGMAGAASMIPGVNRMLPKALPKQVWNAGTRAGAGYLAGWAGDEAAGLAGVDTNGRMRQAGTALGFGASIPPLTRGLRRGIQQAGIGMAGKGVDVAMNAGRVTPGAEALARAGKGLFGLPHQAGNATKYLTEWGPQHAAFVGLGAVGAAGNMAKGQLQDLHTKIAPVAQKIEGLTGKKINNIDDLIGGANELFEQAQGGVMGQLSGFAHKAIEWWKSLPPASQAMMVSSIVPMVLGAATGNTGAGLLGGAAMAGAGAALPHMFPQTFGPGQNWGRQPAPRPMDPAQNVGGLGATNWDHINELQRAGG